MRSFADAMSSRPPDVTDLTAADSGSVTEEDGPFHIAAK